MGNFGDLFLIIDLAAIAFGVFLLVAPMKAYNFGTKADSERKIPKNWNIVGRIIGAVMLIIGALFIYTRFA